MRAAKFTLFAWVIAGCHGPPVGPPLDGGGSPGRGGGSGVAGTGGSGVAGTGGSGVAGTGGSGAAGTSGSSGTGAAGTSGSGGTGAGGTGTNPCLRCETQCTNGVCDLAMVRQGTGAAGLQSDAMSAALDGERLYVVFGSGVQVVSVPKNGGADTILFPNQTCSGCVLTVAVDDADVFFAGLNAAQTPAVLAVPKGGGTARTVCTTPSAVPGQLTFEGPNVYWYRQDTGLERCPKAGGSSSPAATSSGIVLRMASRAGSVVWANRETGVVTRLDTGTLATRVLGVTRNSEPVLAAGVCDVVEAGTLAYWVHCAWPHTVYVEGTGNVPTELGRALGTGGGGTDQSGSIGVDGDYVYFTEYGLLNRIPKAGGAVEPRARVRDSTGAVFKGRITGFDDRYVYLHRSGGSLYRVIK